MTSPRTAVASVLESIGDSVPPGLWERFMELVLAPLEHQEMLWMVIPLVTSVLLMELYFGRYPAESMGWSSAVGNSLLLVFVAVDQLRYLHGDLGSLYVDGIQAASGKTMLALGLLGGGISMMFFNYFKVLPAPLSFTLSAAFGVNVAAYLTLVLVYTNVLLDRTTLIAACLLYGALHVLRRLLKPLIPRAQPRPPRGYPR